MAKLYKSFNIKTILLLSFFAILVYTGCKVYPEMGKKVNLDRSWSVYKADAEGTGYSILDEIN
ncbi:MAG TPA: hypothetical protein PLN99_15855, partial [Daejeonella sp.]|nr:hypothetical protein [Daejeonella sp.]